MASQPTGAIRKWWGLCKRGWELCKQHRVLAFLPSIVGALIVLPLIVRLFAALIYAGVSYFVLKSTRLEGPRFRDIFKGAARYWRALLVWFCLIALIELFIILIGVWIIPLIWAISMLVFPPLIDERKAIGFALNPTFPTVFAWENWARFWLCGLIIPLLCYRGVSALLFGLVITVPLAVCIRVIAYGDTFNPRGAFQTDYTGPISRIGQLSDQIVGQIRFANDNVKPLLENSIEYIDSVFEKAADLSQRLQQIDQYLEATNKQTLEAEKTQISRQLSAAPTQTVSAQYEEALRTLEQRDQNHGRLEILREEINAQLTTIRVALDNTHLKIIRIKTTEISNVRLESDNVSESLQNLQIETDVLLESLDEIAEAR